MVKTDQSALKLGTGRCTPTYFHAWIGSDELSRQTHQSVGGVSIPQKLLGLSNSSPVSHEAFSLSGIPSTTRPFLLRPFETSFTITNISFFNCSLTITAQPCAFTTIVLHST